MPLCVLLFWKISRDWDINFSTIYSIMSNSIDMEQFLREKTNLNKFSIEIFFYFNVLKMKKCQKSIKLLNHC